MELSDLDAAGLDAARRVGRGNNRRSVNSQAGPVDEIIRAYLEVAGYGPSSTVGEKDAGLDGFVVEEEIAQPGPGKKKAPTGRTRLVGPWRDAA